MQNDKSKVEPKSQKKEEPKNEAKLQKQVEPILAKTAQPTQESAPGVDAQSKGVSTVYVYNITGI